MRDSDRNLSIHRWARGEGNHIILPPHANCRVGGSDIVATFDTHPNTAADYLQEPSDTDKSSVRDDNGLKARLMKGS